MNARLPIEALLPQAQVVTLQPSVGLTFETPCEGSNSMSLCDAGTWEHRISISRHHDGICAPYWITSEQRRDESGKKWTSQAFAVIDDFGSLVEVCPWLR